MEMDGIIPLWMRSTTSGLNMFLSVGKLDVTVYVFQIYLSIVLQPFVGFWPHFSILIFTLPVGLLRLGSALARPPPAHTGEHKHRINSY
jgi:hypothetical protein